MTPTSPDATDAFATITDLPPSLAVDKEESEGTAKSGEVIPPIPHKM